MVAIFGFDGGISIFDALDVGLIFETMERDNKVLPAAANDYDWIRAAWGQDAVYVRSPLNDVSVFWFVGKVARMTEVATGGDGDAAGRGLAGTVHPTEEEAVVSQKHLILVYAKNQLRPPNMGGLYAWNLKL